MSTYTPNEWVVIKVRDFDDNLNDKFIYKVFGGWWGGYLGSDTWRLNSGITKAEKVEYYDARHPDAVIIDFHGYSGSIYRVAKIAYGVGGWRADVLNKMIKDGNKAHGDGYIEIMPENTDWLNFNYSEKLN